ncbi:HNH endonuclease signature motif containing protein [Rhodococcus sp. NPDC058505]|uniref:HNH endonuclease signature motif containing protein n=1 Tax=Rhodococcus sp. NPDC058505 TaxID=3346531 RepID=UPI00364808FF
MNGQVSPEEFRPVACDPVRPPAPPAPPPSVGAIADAIFAAVRVDPTLATGRRADGHGGLLRPPPGALTYRPDAATAALVRARDRHCRFPGCARPAAQCQLDHITEYRTRTPRAGGWTIVSNLQCLCAFHHQLKTLGLWRVSALGRPGIGGNALLWLSALGATAVTLPGGATGTWDDSGLRPRIAGCRGTPTRAPSEPDPDPAPY